jgi:deazaflavin-dependent oxidoreductase (nitroreductase family)
VDRTFVDETNRRVIEQYRAGGPVEGMRRERLLLLTTTGRRSGRPHTVPMMFHRDGDRILVIASAAGAPRHPDWYLNLDADPAVTVELPEETYAGAAVPLTGEDRERTWDMLKRTYPFFADHEAKVDREIPVVELRRAG